MTIKIMSQVADETATEFASFTNDNQPPTDAELKALAIVALAVLQASCNDAVDCFCTDESGNRRA